MIAGCAIRVDRLRAVVVEQDVEVVAADPVGIAVDDLDPRAVRRLKSQAVKDVPTLKLRTSGAVQVVVLLIAPAVLLV